MRWHWHSTLLGFGNNVPAFPGQKRAHQVHGNTSVQKGGLGIGLLLAALEKTEWDFTLGFGGWFFVFIWHNRNRKMREKKIRLFALQRRPQTTESLHSSDSGTCLTRLFPSCWSMRQLDNILTEIHWGNMEMQSTAFVKIRISVPFIYIYTCWFLWLWCNWLSLKMILPEVWGLCLSLIDEQSCQLLTDLRQIKVRILNFPFVWWAFSLFLWLSVPFYFPK